VLILSYVPQLAFADFLDVAEEAAKDGQDYVQAALTRIYQPALLSAQVASIVRCFNRRH
jgi:hypothetical protein